MDGGTATSRNEVQVLETLREVFFPTGILSETAARELIAQYAPHGRVATAAGIETLLRVIEAAIQTPSLLSAFLIGQLCAAIIAGEGPALGRRPHFSRCNRCRRRALLAPRARSRGWNGRNAGQPGRSRGAVRPARRGRRRRQRFQLSRSLLQGDRQSLIAASSHAVPPRREALAAERDLVWVASAPSKWRGSPAKSCATAGRLPRSCVSGAARSRPEYAGSIGAPTRRLCGLSAAVHDPL